VPMNPSRPVSSRRQEFKLDRLSPLLRCQRGRPALEIGPDFGDKLGAHFGIFVVQFPSVMRTCEVAGQIATTMSVLDQVTLQGNLIILEPGRLRRAKLLPSQKCHALKHSLAFSPRGRKHESGLSKGMSRTQNDQFAA
jgi:hypothetical protein